MMVQAPETHNHGKEWKYGNDGKGWYFKFDYDNEMS